MSGKPPGRLGLGSARPRAEPYLSRTPWHGFTPDDMPRDEALPVCPAARCRRAKQCLAALAGLYCRRTHLTKHEQAEVKPEQPLQRRLASVPEAYPPGDLEARMERIGELAAIRRGFDAGLRARWKAGALDHLFGPFKARGLLLAPPPRLYVDERKRGKG